MSAVCDDLEAVEADDAGGGGEEEDEEGGREHAEVPPTTVKNSAQTSGNGFTDK